MKMIIKSKKSIKVDENSVLLAWKIYRNVYNRGYISNYCKFASYELNARNWYLNKTQEVINSDD